MMRNKLAEMIKARIDNKTWCVFDLADYLIANGVVVPPCKVGDVVYMPRIELIGEPQPSEFTIKKIKREEDEEGTHSLYLSDNGQMIKVFDDNDIGKTVFLNKEDAERALKVKGDSR